MSEFKYSQSCLPKRILLSQILKQDPKSFIGKEVVVGGWVRTGREQQKGQIAFVQITDGSCSGTLQAVVDKDVHDLKSITATGASVAFRGTIVESQGKNQDVELKVSKVVSVGTCEASSYPLSKVGHPLEHLRGVPHLRPRSNLLSAVFRIRNALSFATHQFYQQNDFMYVTTPIITASDCEGAGEMFQVSSLLPAPGTTIEPSSGATEEEVKKLENLISEQGAAVRTLKEQKASKEDITSAVKKLQQHKKDLGKLKEKGMKVWGLPHTMDDKHQLDYTQDFFKCAAFLTVSGQLQGEAFASAFSNIYTFCPAFRAEESHTSRHLAEFWMIEPEVAYCDLQDTMNLAEDYVKFCCQWIVDNNLEDVRIIDGWRKRQQQQAAKKAKQQQKGKKGQQQPAAARVATETAEERLKNVLANPFGRISYTEAIEKLLVADKTFENEVSWGIDLASEHERYIAEELFKKPTIIYDYPKDIKAFYMRRNEDGKTVAAMDLVCPQIGELIGGSQREERVDELIKAMDEFGLDQKDFDWYLDLRRYGSVMHSGFGLGFERLILFVTGMENIRDVVPFPRAPCVPPL